MAFIDDPKAWILRLFELEEREGRGSNCQRFPEGVRPASVPLEEGEAVYGIFKAKYCFTPLAFVMLTPHGAERVRWSEIRGCTSRHGEGDKKARLTLNDGRAIEVSVGELAVGHSGRISQLFHQLIERHGVGASLGPPLLSIEEFFNAADAPDCIAPNLEPHPSLDDFRELLNQFAQRSGVNAVLLHRVDTENGIPIVDGIVVRTSLPLDVVEQFAAVMRADGVIKAPDNVMRKLGTQESGESVWLLPWD